LVYSNKAMLNKSYFNKIEILKNAKIKNTFKKWNNFINGFKIMAVNSTQFTIQSTFFQKIINVSIEEF